MGLEFAEEGLRESPFGHVGLGFGAEGVLRFGVGVWGLRPSWDYSLGSHASAGCLSCDAGFATGGIWSEKAFAVDACRIQCRDTVDDMNPELP